jgi:NAD(P)H-dependent flavin oxidoreductase YrpB (nitropropane dioxygenase family)
VNFLVSDFSEESFAVALGAGAPIVSFALGDPGCLVQRVHDAGAKVIHQVHTVHRLSGQQRAASMS